MATLSGGLRRLTNESSGAVGEVLDTAREFIGNLLAPAWPIGWSALGLGAVLWLWGMVVLFRGREA